MGFPLTKIEWICIFERKMKESKIEIKFSATYTVYHFPSCPNLNIVSTVCWKIYHIFGIYMSRKEIERIRFSQHIHRDDIIRVEPCRSLHFQDRYFTINHPHISTKHKHSVYTLYWCVERTLSKKCSTLNCCGINIQAYTVLCKFN